MCEAGSSQNTTYLECANNQLSVQAAGTWQSVKLNVLTKAMATQLGLDEYSCIWFDISVSQS